MQQWAGAGEGVGARGMGSEGENKMREGAVGFEKGKEEMMGEGTENCGHAGEGSQGSGLVALIFSVTLEGNRLPKIMDGAWRPAEVGTGSG